MSQLSFFGADTMPPALADLSGLLAAHGRARLTDDGAVLTVEVDAEWRARAIVQLVTDTGVEADIAVDGELFTVSTSTDSALVPLATQWNSSDGKTVPTGWVPSSRAQRAWFLASGRMEVEGAQYVLGLDPTAPDTHAVLAQALMRAGIAPTLIGTHGTGGPGLRISGRRRLTRLVENIGAPPDADAARRIWPHVEPGDHHL
ncbi:MULTISPECIES: hypothetical protein [Rhodococcus]|uniref:hypothetical protein n=1 Tax=Rhodococcus rhodochrous TaxID=1829 RepID=UPI00132F004B|nr:hypothetical protein [Rhodococcus rhodochrous]QHG81075.1 hypothetical protein D1O33_03320 [Rhodococcus rhodochrous]QOH54915.1 hypothetical protein C6Y44_02255 [Rhodococcus rhodochrous]